MQGPVAGESCGHGLGFDKQENSEQGGEVGRS